VIDKLVAWLHKTLAPVTKLGGGMKWVTRGGTVFYLWPFVFVAGVVALFWLGTKL